MTNPPFYASEAEMLESANKKQRPPNSACTGGPMEMITPGGELAFVSKMIEESMSPEARERIQWFTSMLGKLASVSTLVERLRERKCANYAVTEFVQGQKTRRWAVAWSWQDLRPSTIVARGIPRFEKRLLPFPTDFALILAEANIETVAAKLTQQMQALELQFRWKAALYMGVGMASGDVWSRKARRRKARSEDKNEDEDMADHEDAVEAPALVFKITVSKSTEEEGVDAVKVLVRWLQGRDAVLFESFCGWLKRKLENP
jgi:23S rRNA (adenine1618-N6)-methyltransferase